MQQPSKTFVTCLFSSYYHKTRISSRLRSDNIKPHRESRSLQAVQGGIFIDKGTVVIELSASRFLAHETPPNCAVRQTNRHVT